MKKLNRRLISVLAVTLIVFSLLQLSGCYVINSGKMKNVEGTYELTNYTTDKNEIEANGISLYIVIKSDGTGYYAYRDNDTPLYFAELRCRYTADSEKEGYYSYVEIDFKGDNDWVKLGVDSRFSTKTLNSSKPKYKGNIIEGNLEIAYYIDVDFTRVDRATDLSYLREELGDATLLPYGAVRFDGVYFYSGASSENNGFPSSEYVSPFVYSYINIDLYENKGEIWYMLKADEQQRNEKFDVRIAVENGDYVLYLGEVRAVFGENAPYYGDMKIPVKLTVDGIEYDGSYEHHLGTGKSVEDIPTDIELQINAYQREKE